MDHVLIIDDNVVFAQQLTATLGTPIEPLIPAKMGLREILGRLGEFANNEIEGIYISAELKSKECPRRSDYGGVELLKHIRLTSELECIRLLPIVVGMWRKLDNYLRADPENIILSSPGVAAIAMPFKSGTLSRLFEKIEQFQSFESMYRALRDYFPVTDRDHRGSAHDYRNRVGAARFAKELFGPAAENESLVKDFEDFRKVTPWIKKMDFHQNGMGRAIPHIVAVDGLRKLREACKDIKILLIDDEHRTGWSYALCRALVQDVPINEFEPHSERISVANGRFECIDSFDGAVRCLDEKKTALRDSLEKWSKAHSQALHLQEKWQKANSDIPNRLNGLKRSIDVKEKAVGEFKGKVDSATFEVDRVESELNQQMASFLSSYQQNPERILKEPDVVPFLGRYYEARTQRDRLYVEWVTARQSQEALEQELKDLQNQLSQLYEDQKTLDENLERAERLEKEYLAILNSQFEPDIIFLDLRLVPSEDANRTISESSGINLLREIKIYDPSIPVIILTASEKAPSYAEALSRGAEGYWMKDISSTSELVASITKLTKNLGFRRCIWRKIRQVESLRILRRYTVCGDGTVQSEMISNAEYLQKVRAVLRECFAFLIGTESGVSHSITQLESHEEIALRLGEIYEFRVFFPDELKDLKAKEVRGIWESLKKNRILTEKDDTIREYRNNAAHFYSKRFADLSRLAPSVPRQQVMECFEYTLDALLAVQRQYIEGVD